MKNSPKQRNNKRWLFWLVVVVSLLVPFVFYIFFRRCLCFSATFWGFYGSYLSFVGTVVLGIIAVWQNKKIRVQAENENRRIADENEKLLRLQEAQYVSMISITKPTAQLRNVTDWKSSNGEPAFTFIDLFGTDSAVTGICCFDFALKNESNFPISKVITHLQICNCNRIDTSLVRDNDMTLYIKANGEQYVRIGIPTNFPSQAVSGMPYQSDYEETAEIELLIISVNVFGYKTVSKLKFTNIRRVYINDAVKCEYSIETNMRNSIKEDTQP